MRDCQAHLAALVAFPTVSAVSNLDLIEHVSGFATAHGAEVRRFPDASGSKASLAIRIGPEAPGGVVFSGHTDVVPVEGQPWTGDPWALRESGGRLIGRGATDMKGFLACTLAVLPEIAAMPLQRPVWLAFSYDEEVGCTGVGPMAEWLGQNARPRLAVIGEATGMELVSAHKGGCIGWMNIHGKPGHSSQPDLGVNAIPVAARLIGEILEIEAEMRRGPLFEALDPPFSTIQVNQIQGGTHGNILAAACRFFWEMRLVPGTTPEPVLARIRAAMARLEPAMKAVDPACGIEMEILAHIPPLAPSNDAALEAELLALLGQTKTRAVSYGTEAGIFHAAGIPSVVIGPGDIRDAHQPDESIEIAQLDACADFLVRLAERSRA